MKICQNLNLDFLKLLKVKKMLKLKINLVSSSIYWPVMTQPRHSLPVARKRPSNRSTKTFKKRSLNSSSLNNWHLKREIPCDNSFHFTNWIMMNKRKNVFVTFWCSSIENCRLYDGRKREVRNYLAWQRTKKHKKLLKILLLRRSIVCHRHY